jgi:hypothetical protein
VNYNSKFCHSYGKVWEATGESSAPAEAPFDRASFDQSGMTIPSNDRMVSPVLRFSTGTAEGSNSD